MERANPSIEEMLRAYVGKCQNDWDERLGMVEFAYNNFVQAILLSTFAMADILLALSTL